MRQDAISAMQRAWLTIDLNAIRTNVRTLSRSMGASLEIMGVIKADAYGHGLVPVAEAAMAAQAGWLGVATVQEGVILRQAGIALPICLLCAFAPDEAEQVVRYALTPMVSDIAQLQALTRTGSIQPLCDGITLPSQSGFAVHLEIDTGMGRAGIVPEYAVRAWQEAQRAGLNVTGLATHFADADNADPSFTQQQETLFNQARQDLEAAGAHFDWIHLDNSPGILNSYGAGGNLIRPGLLLYGIIPHPWSSHASHQERLAPQILIPNSQTPFPLMESEPGNHDAEPILPDTLSPAWL